MPENLLGYLENARPVALAIVTNHDWMLASFTGLLAIFTARLWYTTQKDTRILQRAYIAVEPLGIHLMQNGSELIGHVAMKNAGHLPARKVSWFVNIHASESGEEHDSLFPLQPDKGNIVIVPGAAATRGSAKGVQVQTLNELSGAGAGVDRELEKSAYLYVWGAVRYDDGFKKMRTTRFCHRYSWNARKQYDNRCVIDAVDACYHEYANGAN
jgi:hypothetical protein